MPLHSLTEADPLDDFEHRDLTFDGERKLVHVAGSGPGVIVMAEMPGITPHVARFARWVRDAGFRVYMPSLFGQDGAVAEVENGVAVFRRSCISAEFRVFGGGETSPVTRWLRELARLAHAECGGPGVGAVGMCFTGNFAMAMMTEPAVVAPVMSQPSLPIGSSKASKAAMGLSADEVAIAKRRFADEGLSGMCLRFSSDPLTPDARIETFRQTFGEALEIVNLPDEAGRMALGRPYPHSVLTINLRDDDPASLSKRTEERVIAFFKERTAP